MPHPPQPPPPQSARPKAQGDGQIPHVLQGLEYQERRQRERAAEILESTEDLIWYSNQMGETIAQTRLHFEKIMCGIDTGMPPPVYRDAVVGDKRPPRSEMTVLTSELVGSDEEGVEEEGKGAKRKAKRKASTRLSDGREEGEGDAGDGGTGERIEVKEEDVTMRDVDDDAEAT